MMEGDGGKGVEDPQEISECAAGLEEVQVRRRQRIVAEFSIRRSMKKERLEIQNDPA
jgi:hypothetical protein